MRGLVAILKDKGVECVPAITRGYKYKIKDDLAPDGAWEWASGLRETGRDRADYLCVIRDKRNSFNSPRAE